jgi:hypothetical protein
LIPLNSDADIVWVLQALTIKGHRAVRWLHGGIMGVQQNNERFDGSHKLPKTRIAT